MSDKKWIKDPLEERLVKCYTCEGKGAVPGSAPNLHSYFHSWFFALITCKECGGFGSVVLKPIDQASTV